MKDRNVRPVFIRTVGERYHFSSEVVVASHDPVLMTQAVASVCENSQVRIPPDWRSGHLIR